MLWALSSSTSGMPQSVAIQLSVLIDEVDPAAGCTKEKGPQGGPSSASNHSSRGDCQAATACNCQFFGMITASIA